MAFRGNPQQWVLAANGIKPPYRCAAQASQDSEKQKMVYMLSWTGENGHPSSMVFEQGSTIYILPDRPPAESSRDDLMAVRFNSFQMTGKLVGLMRYTTGGGEHKEVYPGQISRRVIQAQTLAAKHSVPEANAEMLQDSTHQAVRRSKRDIKAATRSLSPSKPEPGASSGKKSDRGKDERRQKDAMHIAACQRLEGHEEWIQIITEEVQAQHRNGSLMSFQTLKLSEAANCPEFGPLEYSVLQGVSFARCKACHIIRQSVAAMKKHRCRSAEQPQQALLRQQPAAPSLGGGIQLDTTVLVQVSSGSVDNDATARRERALPHALR